MTEATNVKAKASDTLKTSETVLASSSDSVHSASGRHNLQRADDSKGQSASRSELLVELSNATLVYLACIVEQDVNRKKGCDEIRNQLDQIFRRLSVWKKTLLDGRIQLIADEATKTTPAIEVVIFALLIIAHQLTHLPSLSEPWLAATDQVFRTVSEVLQNKIMALQDEETRVEEGCPICDKADLEQDKPTAYLENLKVLISDLEKDSKPLQVVLYRLERYARD